MTEETERMSTPTEKRSDLQIRNIWKHQTDGILEQIITNDDAPSNMHREPEAVLLSHEREKKKFLPACPDQRRHSKNLAGSLAMQLAKSYSETTNFKKSRMRSAILYEPYILFRNYKLQEGCVVQFCTSHTSMHPRIPTS